MLLPPQEGGARLGWQRRGGRSGRGRLFKVHGGGGHGLQGWGSWVALLLLFDGGPVRGHLVEARGLRLVASVHKDIEAWERGGGSCRDLTPTQVKLGVVGGHEVRAVAFSLVAEGLARVG